MGRRDRPRRGGRGQVSPTTNAAAVACVYGTIRTPERLEEAGAGRGPGERPVELQVVVSLYNDNVMSMSMQCMGLQLAVAVSAHALRQGVHIGPD